MNSIAHLFTDSRSNPRHTTYLDTNAKINPTTIDISTRALIITGLGYLPFPRVVNEPCEGAREKSRYRYIHEVPWGTLPAYARIGNPPECAGMALAWGHHTLHVNMLVLCREGHKVHPGPPSLIPRGSSYPTHTCRCSGM